MTIEELKKLVCDLVVNAKELVHNYTEFDDSPINYACIFCQSDSEYNEFSKAANSIGKVIEETPSGPLYQIEQLETVSGKLQLLKIRKPDTTRTERGDADFTVFDFELFRSMYLHRPEFKLIQKPTFEMIELMAPGYNVRAYFSNPPLDKQLGLV